MPDEICTLNVTGHPSAKYKRHGSTHCPAYIVRNVRDTHVEERQCGLEDIAVNDLQVRLRFTATQL